MARVVRVPVAGAFAGCVKRLLLIGGGLFVAGYGALGFVFVTGNWFPFWQMFSKRTRKLRREFAAKNNLRW